MDVPGLSDACSGCGTFCAAPGHPHNMHAQLMRRGLRGSCRLPSGRVSSSASDSGCSPSPVFQSGNGGVLISGPLDKQTSCSPHCHCTVVPACPCAQHIVIAAEAQAASHLWKWL